MRQTAAPRFSSSAQERQRWCSTLGPDVGVSNVPAPLKPRTRTDMPVFSSSAATAAMEPADSTTTCCFSTSTSNAFTSVVSPLGLSFSETEAAQRTSHIAQESLHLLLAFFTLHAERELNLASHVSATSSVSTCALLTLTVSSIATTAAKQCRRGVLRTQDISIHFRLWDFVGRQEKTMPRQWEHGNMLCLRLHHPRARCSSFASSRPTTRFTMVSTDRPSCRRQPAQAHGVGAVQLSCRWECASDISATPGPSFVAHLRPHSHSQS